MSPGLVYHKRYGRVTAADHYDPTARSPTSISARRQRSPKKSLFAISAADGSHSLLRSSEINVKNDSVEPPSRLETEKGRDRFTVPFLK